MFRKAADQSNANAQNNLGITWFLKGYPIEHQNAENPEPLGDLRFRSYVLIAH
jgi:hypothetical protein